MGPLLNFIFPEIACLLFYYSPNPAGRKLAGGVLTFRQSKAVYVHSVEQAVQLEMLLHAAVIVPDQRPRTKMTSKIYISSGVRMK